MASESHTRVVKALEGNERVFYHWNKPRVAVWYGGVIVRVFDSDTFIQKERYVVGDPSMSISEQEDAVIVKLSQLGFHRTGRNKNTTTLTEHK